MALPHNFDDHESHRPNLRLVEGEADPSLDSLVQETLSSREPVVANHAATSVLKSSVEAILDGFRATNQTFSYDNPFGRHGIRVAELPNSDGTYTDHAYVTISEGGYYRIEQTRTPDGEPVSTYVSMITEESTQYPPAGLVLEGPFRSLSSPYGGDSMTPDELPADMLERFTTDLQHGL